MLEVLLCPTQILLKRISLVTTPMLLSAVLPQRLTWCPVLLEAEVARAISQASIGEGLAVESVWEESSEAEGDAKERPSTSWEEVKQGDGGFDGIEIDTEL